MAYVNTITVCGHMTADLQSQKTDRGESCFFTLAVNRSKDEADFIPFRVNGNFITDKLRQQLVKGAPVLVTGHIESGSYKGKDNTTRTYFYVAPESIQPGVNGNFNSAILFGNLTADPELRTTSSGTNVASFDVASNRRYKDKNNEWKDATPSFIHVNAWEAKGDFVARYFKKGSCILLSGSVRSRRFNDKNGNARTAYDFVASNISFADYKRDNAQPAPAPQPAPTQHASAMPAAQPQPGVQYDVPDQYADFETVEDDGDLPF